MKCSSVAMFVAAIIVGSACSVNVAPSVPDEDIDAGKPMHDAGTLDAGTDDAGADDAGVDAGVDAGPIHPLVPAAWGVPVPIVEANTPYTESHASMSGDMLRLCFDSNRPGGLGGEGDIWCAFRDSVDAPFSPPVNQGNLNGQAADWMPGLSDDGMEMFFASDRSMLSQMNIYHAVWVPEAGGYGHVEKVGELNAGNNIWSGSPILTKSGLSLYFESTRTGGYGSMDIYVATRETPWSPFSQIFNVSALNSGYLDTEPCPSGDVKVITFSSERPGGTLPHSIWRSDATPTGWSTPVPAKIEGASAFSAMSNSRILSDGSLMFSATIGTEKQDLYIAPPKW